MLVPQARRQGASAQDYGPAVVRAGRNDPCPCGSGAKYKKCCLLRKRSEAAVALPAWLIDSDRKLHRFEKYATKVYGLPRLLASFHDGRRNTSTQPTTYSTWEVVNALVHSALLRRPSINAIEGDLKEADFQKLVGLTRKPDEKAFSAEVISNVLDKLHLSDLRNGIEDVFWTAERNKAFREGSYGALQCVALDGWEPFCSYERCCPDCLTRQVSVKDPNSGDVTKRTQYYHRYVVAMLIGPLLDVVLDIEPVRNADARGPGEDMRHEGELTAAHRLIDRLRQTYGTFIDTLVMDALYANGPVMTKLDAYSYDGAIVLKKDDNEPLKEALALWKGQPPCETFYDDDAKEHIEFWNADDVDTLDTYKGKTRVVRAVVTRDDGKRTTWCFALVGRRAQRLSLPTALKLLRSRWHIENTGFGQWVKYWNLGRVYRHTNNAIQAVLLLWMLVFNLLQLFVYRRLKRERKPKDPCETIISIVASMFRDVGAIPERIPWEVLAYANST